MSLLSLDKNIINRTFVQSIYQSWNSDINKSFLIQFTLVRDDVHGCTNVDNVHG